LAQLADETAASDSTIRRDLDLLERAGSIKRTHGGAYFVGEGGPLPALEERSAAAVAEKRAIARAAASMVADGDALLLDGGTTTYEVARELVGRSLQVVTNSLPVANLFAASWKADLVLLGGYIHPRTGVALGPLTIQMLASVHVRRTIMSVGGITEGGYFNSNLLLVETERRMMQAADQVIVVADHTKFGRRALAHLGPLSAIDHLIVDEGVDTSWVMRVREAAVEVTIARLEERG
jgi:DeoR/GlpR family transcriptional regulator of sugar metabolism